MYVNVNIYTFILYIVCYLLKSYMYLRYFINVKENDQKTISQQLTIID